MTLGSTTVARRCTDTAHAASLIGMTGTTHVFFGEPVKDTCTPLMPRQDNPFKHSATTVASTYLQVFREPHAVTQITKAEIYWGSNLRPLSLATPLLRQPSSQTLLSGKRHHRDGSKALTLVPAIQNGFFGRCHRPTISARTRG